MLGFLFRQKLLHRTDNREQSEQELVLFSKLLNEKSTQSSIIKEENKHHPSYGPRREKTCLRGFANNKSADQPAHPRSLISAFVIRFVESIIC